MNLDDETLTIGELKGMLEMRFPGGPPRSVQRLFLGSRLLKDDEPASSLREDDDDEDEDQTRTALTLDVVPPVADGRPRPPDDLEDRVRAYAAESAALDHMRRVLADEFDEDLDDEEDDDEEYNSQTGSHSQDEDNHINDWYEEGKDDEATPGEPV